MKIDAHIQKRRPTMKWTDISTNLPSAFTRLKSEFPYLEASSMPLVVRQRATFEAYLADRHDLTLLEAHDALDDFLMLAPKPHNPILQAA